MRSVIAPSTSAAITAIATPSSSASHGEACRLPVIAPAGSPPNPAEGARPERLWPRHAGEAGRHEPLEADEEAAVVEDGRRRADQQARERAYQGSHRERKPARACGGDAHETRAGAVDRRRAQGLAGERALEEQVEQHD